ncbi:MAG TPA: nucleoside-diphosphate sugar epimerase/dehydratase [Methylomusa anaerophila]|uniref:UDP-N-acetyl-alpha-D-glucosamine C6 dehydratase n=1 Tax=Methylomusa anaerophila TaxID=1930071 RepID=A0A348AI19_9FIRM|nr:nucleoside-diphosphate sugar epimerase/dehydratase [Methylomusa anaerophila]BBB90717.1 UDP-N-acetyl-alpha-D-glucosamine C6 dehydratase [Methylomusa anaerophila]HML88680.1 nucleoside-diphosphate sugar epimerase/dehydratase [Methylomusa anaerophila]
MNNAIRLLSMVLLDGFIVGTVPYIAALIRFEGAISEFYNSVILYTIPLTIFIRLGTFYAFGFYNRLWRYAGAKELLVIVGAVTVSSAIIAVISALTVYPIPKSIQLMSWFINIVFIGITRVIAHVSNFMPQGWSEHDIGVLIIGAGDTGAMVARALSRQDLAMRRNGIRKLVGFIDDEPYKQNRLLFGAKVLGKRSDLRRIISKHNVQEIILAIPSINGEFVREILADCRKERCRLKIAPNLDEWIKSGGKTLQLRSLQLEDLLRRSPVELNMGQVAEFLKDKSVLVTGAGGSIGSELCRQIASMSPRILYLLGKGENSIYAIESELREKYQDLTIEPLIVDVRDSKRINLIFSRCAPQVVFHAAAHKHVPLMEKQPDEAVSNNIFGTKTVAEAADRFGTEVFVMISTDKAVNPTSVMGATKRMAELIIQDMNKTSRTTFAAVRFGNVLGSRGSVIPLFQKQIAAGGPVTITHPDMKRYFMTIPEASSLVLQAGALAQGGEVFVLDMGEPVKILDMACSMIQIAGLIPHVDIKFDYIGLRPGEKLFEELLTAEEGVNVTKHEKIYTAKLKNVDRQNLQKGLTLLQQAASFSEIIQILSYLIPSYRPPAMVKEAAS